MPPSPSVQEQVVDVIVSVLGADPTDVVPDARLTDLGADSLTVVEIGEGLGQRFDTYLTDDTIDALVTVQDAIDAVAGASVTPVDEAPAVVPSPAFAAPADDDTPALVVPPDAEKRAWGAVRGLAVFGLVIGALIGLAMTAVVAATGLDSVTLPPLPSSSDTPKPTPSPKPTTPKTTAPATPQPTLVVDKPQVGPGERFVLSGTFPELGADAALDIQFREAGGKWDKFPVDTTTRGQGEFKVQLYTSRTGPREFRVRNTATGQTTPVVAVQIG